METDAAMRRLKAPFFWYSPSVSAALSGTVGIQSNPQMLLRYLTASVLIVSV